jgi:glutamate dehydrogenase
LKIKNTLRLTLKRYKPWLKRLLEVGVMYSANSPLVLLVKLMALFYQDAFRMRFPSAYQEIYGPDHAHQHISLFDRLDGSDDLAIDFYQDQQELEQHLRVTLFHRNEPLELSDMVPMLENLGFRVVMEHPYCNRP